MIEWTHAYACPQDLADIPTEDLIYVDARTVTDEALIAEQERCQEVVDLTSEAPDDDPDGVVNDEYIERVNHIEEIRSTRRRA